MRMCVCGGLIVDPQAPAVAGDNRCKCPSPRLVADVPDSDIRYAALMIKKRDSEKRGDALQDHRRVLLEYLRVKTDAEDWHGVADAACDLREIDAELKGMRHL